MPRGMFQDAVYVMVILGGPFFIPFIGFLFGFLEEKVFLKSSNFASSADNFLGEPHPARLGEGRSSLYVYH